MCVFIQTCQVKQQQTRTITKRRKTKTQNNVFKTIEKIYTSKHTYVHPYIPTYIYANLKDDTTNDE